MGGLPFRGSALAALLPLGFAAAACGGVVVVDGGGGGGGAGGQGGGGVGGSCAPAAEVCDGLDNDCDGTVDDGCTCLQGQSQACYTGTPGTVGEGACVAGTQGCVGGEWGPCEGEILPGVETCNALDDDCDGDTDEELGEETCGIGACEVTQPVCQGGVMTGCVPAPPSAESCDGIDNNCDGLVDAEPCGCDGSGMATCVNGQLVCSAPSSAYFEEDFSDNGAGWQLDTSWEIGPTTVSSGQVTGFPDPWTDHSGSADNGVAGVEIGGNAPTNLHDFHYLTSPAFDTAGAPSVHLDYWRWLNSDYLPFMQNSVEVFDGSAWVTLWQSGGPPAVEDSAWQPISFDLTNYKNAGMRVRFGVRVASSGAFLVSSWNIDDVRISGLACP